MKNIYKIAISIITVICVIFTPANFAFASTKTSTIPKNIYKYVALGDSIGFGMSASEGKDYVSLFGDYLKSQPGNSKIQIYNLAKPGDTTEDLLNKLKNNVSMKDTLKDATVITISIGGNNLLSTVIQEVSRAFAVNSNNNPNFMNEIAAAITSNPKKDAIIEGLTKSRKLPIALAEGVVQFVKQWDDIIKSINTLAPKAKVYVTTIYNPFNSQDSLHDFFEKYIKVINGIMEVGSIPGSYKVVDSYKVFKDYNGTDPLVNFNVAKGKLDPHPTDKGHSVIFQAHIDRSALLETTIASFAVNKAERSKSQRDILFAKVLVSQLPPVTMKSEFEKRIEFLSRI
ncbi:MAG: GDSL-type esterase/lipase family protein [Clostridium sp.]|uniref:GDSL-type esterase/lipase family protein n=1 Tax=Clostridium sp. TaxID=1506 RepID=UPI003D6CBDB1